MDRTVPASPRSAPRDRRRWGAIARLAVWPLLPLAASCPSSPPGETTLGDTIARLSEPGGYFDTDNLISNERSYLHAVSDLRAAGVRGGAYLGVGPGQNFSYLAEIEPRVAFILDIRRDNVLQHLMYRVLFRASRNRLEFLTLLTGRPLPPDPDRWTEAPLDSILGWVETHPPDSASALRARRIVSGAFGGIGWAGEPGDLATIARFHGEFIRDGLSLRFRSHGRAPQFYYPTLGELLTEVDREGERVSYVATEERFRRVRRMQLEDRLIPIVGDLAGPTALRAVGEELRRRGLEVSAFYTSNVEFYLFGAGTFSAFIENLRELPLAPDAVLIKSFFRGFRGAHPLQVPGYFSTQLVQNAGELIAGWDEGRVRTYGDVVTAGLVVPARAP